MSKEARVYHNGRRVSGPLRKRNPLLYVNFKRISFRDNLRRLCIIFLILFFYLLFRQ